MKAGLHDLVPLLAIVSGLSAQVDNSEVAWQCHDEPHMIILFTDRCCLDTQGSLF